MALLGKCVIGFALVGIAVASWDMMDTQHTITYDQIYAQAQVRKQHSPYVAKVIARQYGRRLEAAFQSEPKCNGLRFSIRANKRVIGKPGRWNLNVDMVSNDEQDETPSLQSWSLVLPNRDGAEGPDMTVVSAADEPPSMMKKACEAVRQE